MDFDTLSIGIGLVIGFLCTFFARELYMERKIARLEAENIDLDVQVKSLQNTLNGRSGIGAKKEKAERMQSLMLEFVEAIKVPDAKPGDVIKALALKYPDVAIDLVKKGIKL